MYSYFKSQNAIELRFRRGPFLVYHRGGIYIYKYIYIDIDIFQSVMKVLHSTVLVSQRSKGVV